MQSNNTENEKLNTAINQFNQLIDELNNRELNPEVIENIHNEIAQINSATGTDKELKKSVQKAQTRILWLIESRLKLVPKNKYRNTWMVLGMTVFGVPLGVAFGFGTSNMGLLGIGLPIGMAIGLAVGSGMDQKAFKEGRQLAINLKY